MALVWGEGEAGAGEERQRADAACWTTEVTSGGGPNVFTLYARLEIATCLAVLSNYLSNAQWDL